MTGSGTLSPAYITFMICGFTNLFWMFAAVVVVLAKRSGSEPPKAARTVFHELRPFYLLLVLVGNVALMHARGASMWVYILVALHVLIWFGYKDADDEDDRWKRRRRRLTERVAQSGGRLITVTGGAA